MKILKVIAVASAVLSLSACAGMGYDRPYADNTTYVAPRASMDAGSAAPGAGAAGGGGAGARRM